MQPFQIVLAVDDKGNMGVSHPPGLSPMIAIGLLELAKATILAPLTAGAQPLQSQPQIVAAPADILNRINGSFPDRHKS